MSGDSKINMDVVLATIQSNQDEIQRMRGTLSQLVDEIKILKDENKNLKTKVRNLENIVNSNTGTNNSGTITTTLEPKVADPEFFTGVRKKTRTFLLQLQNVFFAQPARYTESKSKVSFAISFLRGAAMEWIVPYLESNHSMLNSFN